MAAATALLTILPTPARWQAAAAWPRALRALPVIGLGIGLASGAAAWLAAAAGVPAPAAALLGLLAGVILTGGLHEDGLADVADALGGRNRERRLEILRDVHAGAFAILALVFAIGLQAAALTALLERGALATGAALLAAHVLSRGSMVALAYRLPPAREDGMGHGVARPGIGVVGQAGMAMLIASLAALAPAFGVVRAFAAVFITVVMAVGGMEWLARKYFGGQTGDVLGATEVIARTITLLTLASVDSI